MSLYLIINLVVCILALAIGGTIIFVTDKSSAKVLFEKVNNEIRYTKLFEKLTTFGLCCIAVCLVPILFSPEFRLMVSDTNTIQYAKDTAKRETQFVTVEKKEIVASYFSDDKYAITYQIPFSCYLSDGSCLENRTYETRFITKEDFEKVSIGDKYDRLNYRFTEGE